MDFQEAINKVERFISYQDRSEFEIKNKLKLLKVGDGDSRKIINELKQSGTINDERFAKNFVQGKFRIKKWGKIKIRYSLRSKFVKESIIEKSLNAINLDNYLATLEELYQCKRSDFPSNISFEEKAKISRYLQAKGFELEYIMPFIQKD